ncbi:protein of unknown function [Candidatus Nitrosocosmicus franklandus]|uniref:Uncharacterized protein n=1 Tax=Candidatus Nitrosocosmicus franklandianus TaxID=1798806 RepID=A0A484ICS9_9ARCH|nr:protein of unknown function [Candidatus Nitrosocosmicus franklandus]
MTSGLSPITHKNPQESRIQEKPIKAVESSIKQLIALKMLNPYKTAPTTI